MHDRDLSARPPDHCASGSIDTPYCVHRRSIKRCYRLAALQTRAEQTMPVASVVSHKTSCANDTNLLAVPSALRGDPAGVEQMNVAQLPSASTADPSEALPDHVPMRSCDRNYWTFGLTEESYPHATATGRSTPLEQAMTVHGGQSEAPGTSTAGTPVSTSAPGPTDELGFDSTASQMLSYMINAFQDLQNSLSESGQPLPGRSSPTTAPALGAGPATSTHDALATAINRGALPLKTGRGQQPAVRPTASYHTPPRHPHAHPYSHRYHPPYSSVSCRHTNEPAHPLDATHSAASSPATVLKDEYTRHSMDAYNGAAAPSALPRPPRRLPYPLRSASEPQGAEATANGAPHQPPYGSYPKEVDDYAHTHPHPPPPAHNQSAARKFSYHYDRFLVAPQVGVMSRSERSKIREYWAQLSPRAKVNLIRVGQAEVVKALKQQKKASCQCSLCARRRAEIERDLPQLYAAYEVELEHQVSASSPAAAQSSTAVSRHPLVPAESGRARPPSPSMSKGSDASPLCSAGENDLVATYFPHGLQHKPFYYYCSTEDEMSDGEHPYAYPSSCGNPDGPYAYPSPVHGPVAADGTSAYSYPSHSDPALGGNGLPYPCEFDDAYVEELDDAYFDYLYHQQTHHGGYPVGDPNGPCEHCMQSDLAHEAQTGVGSATTSESPGYPLTSAAAHGDIQQRSYTIIDGVMQIPPFPASVAAAFAARRNANALLPTTAAGSHAPENGGSTWESPSDRGNGHLADQTSREGTPIKGTAAPVYGPAPPPTMTITQEAQLDMKPTVNRFLHNSTFVVCTDPVLSGWITPVDWEGSDTLTSLPLVESTTGGSQPHSSSFADEGPSAHWLEKPSAERTSGMALHDQHSIMSVAQDLLQNNGNKFLSMVEQFREHRLRHEPTHSVSEPVQDAVATTGTDSPAMEAKHDQVHSAPSEIIEDAQPRVIDPAIAAAVRTEFSIMLEQRARHLTRELIQRGSISALSHQRLPHQVPETTKEGLVRLISDIMCVCMSKDVNKVKEFVDRYRKNGVDYFNIGLDRMPDRISEVKDALANVVDAQSLPVTGTYTDEAFVSKTGEYASLPDHAYHLGEPAPYLGPGGVEEDEEVYEADFTYDQEYDLEDEYDDTESVTDLLASDEQRAEEERQAFQLFLARIMEQRVVTAFREKVAEEKANELLRELDLEEGSKQGKGSNAKKKKKPKDRKKNKKRSEREIQLEQERLAKDKRRQEDQERQALEAAKEQKRVEERKKRQEAERMEAEALARQRLEQMQRQRAKYPPAADDGPAAIKHSPERLTKRAQRLNGKGTVAAATNQVSKRGTVSAPVPTAEVAHAARLATFVASADAVSTVSTHLSVSAISPSDNGRSPDLILPVVGALSAPSKAKSADQHLQQCATRGMSQGATSTVREQFDAHNLAKSSPVSAKPQPQSAVSQQSTSQSPPPTVEWAPLLTTDPSRWSPNPVASAASSTARPAPYVSSPATGISFVSSPLTAGLMASSPYSVSFGASPVPVLGHALPLANVANESTFQPTDIPQSLVEDLLQDASLDGPDEDPGLAPAVSELYRRPSLPLQRPRLPELLDYSHSSIWSPTADHAPLFGRPMAQSKSAQPFSALSEGPMTPNRATTPELLSLTAATHHRPKAYSNDLALPPQNRISDSQCPSAWPSTHSLGQRATPSDARYRLLDQLKQTYQQLEQIRCHLPTPASSRSSPPTPEAKAHTTVLDPDPPRGQFFYPILYLFKAAQQLFDLTGMAFAQAVELVTQSSMAHMDGRLATLSNSALGIQVGASLNDGQFVYQVTYDPGMAVQALGITPAHGERDLPLAVCFMTF
ncbi:Stress response protein nst1 [Dimargaris verticillata]|uniref:Stress response protein NST1 n=1 Tax=Dimargaris verticillata TaxID=2761393 RepID=A0A9W8E8V7_9FUNG|nr:Stress response protein nst1 [Dimargaris verticillata]